MTASSDPARRPADWAARARIETDLDSTLFVEAAAGSGKTSALVARVVALVDQGRAALREIAAITFTEAAAAELRGRVGAALAEEVDDARVGELRRVALVQLDEAPMTTIHGFAQRLLGDHPIAAGLPVRFEVVDELIAAVRRDERFDRFVDQLFDDPSAADMLRAATVLGIGVDPLAELAAQMSDRFDGLAVPDDPADFVATVWRWTAAVRQTAQGCVGFLDSCTEPDDRLAGRLRRLTSALERTDEGDWLGALQWLVSLEPERKAGGGRQSAWRGPGIEVVRDAVLQYEATRVDALGILNDEVLRQIGGRLAAEAADFAEERRASGSLFFHDLLVLWRDLLRDRPDVRTELRDRYRCILVDEFQDTDPLQYEILRLLGSADEHGGLDPGRLFFVGDPMQSIYRFRGAEIDLFRQVRAEVGGAGVVALTANFRSAPGICSFVSSTFASLLEAGSSSVELDPFRVVDDRSERVFAIGGGDDLLTPERRVAEADDVVSAVDAIVGRGLPVDDDGRVRPARYGDVAVLVPNRGGVRALLGAFGRAGIAVEMAESTMIYATTEIEDVLTVARAVDDRGDDRDVVAALRTSVFALTDAALREHVELGGLWDLATSSLRDRPGHRGVLEALSRLRELRDERAKQGPVGVLAAIIERLSVREIAAFQGGEEALRRLDFLLERARAGRDSGCRSLTELLRFFAFDRRAGARVTTPTRSVDDAVRIFTVHGAKGLEFPVVVLAELGGAIGTRPRTPTLLAADGRVEISLGGGRATFGYDELAADAQAADRDEAIRLAYVAATRARDYLVVSLHHRPRSDGDDASIAALFAASTDLPKAPTPPPLQRQFPGYPAVPMVDEDDPLAYSSAWERVSTEVAKPRSVSPSALDPAQPRASKRVRAATRSGDDDPIDWRRARASSRIGRAVHAVIQRVDLDDPGDLGMLAEQWAVAEGCPEYVDEVAELARAAFDAPIVRSAAAAATCYRELPLTLSTPGGFVEGVVDLCFEGPSGMVIVDYKTDVVRDAAEAVERAAHYRLQAGTYAWAIGAISGRPIDKVAFLFLAPPNGSVEVRVEDIDTAIADARAAVAAQMAGTGISTGHDLG